VSGRHDLRQTLPWMRQGTSHLLATVAKLSDQDLSAPSGLPGWTRAHVVGHLARNAEALTRLATWARTGVERPMYASREQRATEIEASAGLPGPVLRAELATTAADLDEALSALTDQEWTATVRSALGREIPAAEVPWMRIREVWLHAVDLTAGSTIHDLPAGVVDLLIDDVTATLSAKQGCPDVLLAPTDRTRTWQLGARSEASEQPAVSGPAALIAGWLTGRIPPAEVAGPEVPNWI
jgi:maleylpyruvate isomerase